MAIMEHSIKCEALLNGGPRVTGWSHEAGPYGTHTNSCWWLGLGHGLGIQAGGEKKGTWTWQLVVKRTRVLNHEPGAQSLTSQSTLPLHDPALPTHLPLAGTFTSALLHVSAVSEESVKGIGNTQEPLQLSHGDAEPVPRAQLHSHTEMP